MKILRQRGVALVMVLLIVAMATTIAAFMAQQQGFWQREMENGRDRAQARRIAEAGHRLGAGGAGGRCFVKPIR